MGCSSKSRSHEAFTLCYELGLPTIEEEQSSLRARLHAKLKWTDKIKTWLKILQSNPFHSRKRTWITTNTQWEKILLKGMDKYEGPNGGGIPLRLWTTNGHSYELHTRSNSYRNKNIDILREARCIVDDRGFEHEDIPTGLEMNNGDLVPINMDPVGERAEQVIHSVDWQSKEYMEWEATIDVRDCVLERIMSANRSEAFKFYDKFGLGATRGFLRASLTTPLLTQGVCWLVRVRTRAFPRVMERWQKIKRSGRNPNFDKGKCPLCQDLIKNGWEWAHLLTTCDHPDVEGRRRKYLQQPMETLTKELKNCPGIQLRADEEVFDDNSDDGEDDVLTLNEAIAVYLIGGVVKEFFVPSYHRGFGQLDELAVGHKVFGYMYVAQFLSEVVGLWTEKLFPDGDLYYRWNDEFGSVNGSERSIRTMSDESAQSSPLSNSSGGSPV